MPDTLTTNYSWTKPEISGSPTTWGNKLNGNMDGIDAKVFANQTAIGTLNSGKPTQLILNKAAVADGAPITGQLNGVTRWVAQFGDGAVEASGAGSNWSLSRADDSGAIIDTPFLISRGTGQATFLMPLTAAGGTVNINAVGTSDNPAAYFYNSTGTQKGYVGWLQTGDQIAFSKVGGKSITISNTRLYSSMGRRRLWASSRVANRGTSSVARRRPSRTETSRSTRGRRRTLLCICMTAPLTARLSTSTFRMARQRCRTSIPAPRWFLRRSVTLSLAVRGTPLSQAAGRGWSPSDERIKEVVENYDAGLEEVLRLKPVVYRYKGNDTFLQDSSSPHKEQAEETEDVLRPDCPSGRTGDARNGVDARWLY